MRGATVLDRSGDVVTSLTTLPDRPSSPAEFERLLTDAALAGQGWPELLDRLAAATGRPCRLVDPAGALLATTDGGPGLPAEQAARADPETVVIAEDGWQARAVPAVAGERTSGVLLIGEPASRAALALARAAVTALLIESVRRSVGGGTRFEDGAVLIAALRRGTRVDEVAARRFGLDLHAPHCAAVFGHTGERRHGWASAISWLERPVERCGASAYTLVADHRDLSRLRARLEGSLGAGTIVAACGSGARVPDGFGRSFREAERLAGYAARTGRVELSFHDAGLLQVLLAAPDHQLRRFVDRHLGPLLDRPELLATLRLWLASSGSRQSVSEQLHLHRNSVGYRMGQVKARLGVDPLDPDHGPALHAALAAQDLLDEDPPFPDRGPKRLRTPK